MRLVFQAVSDIGRSILVSKLATKFGTSECSFDFRGFWLLSLKELLYSGPREKAIESH